MDNQEKYYCWGCRKELKEDEIYGCEAIQPAPDYVNGVTIHLPASVQYFCKECYTQSVLTPQEAIMYEQLKSRDEQLEETQQELKEAKTLLHDLGYDDERVKALYEVRHNNALTRDKEKTN